MEEIKTWLQDSSDYNAGVALMVRYSRNRHMCNYLSRKTDMLKLRYELSKMAGVADVMPSTPVMETVESPKGQEVKGVEGLPDAIKPYAEAAMEAYHKLRKAHTHLKDAPTDAARMAIRAELMKHLAENERNWAVVNEFQQNGTLPAPAEPLSATQLMSAASVLSRSLKSLETVTDESKRSDLIAKVKNSMVSLRAAGREFKPATMERLRALNLIDDGQKLNDR